ncbi:short chain dehydrogenase/reductase-like protein [Clohesyomyces aquaticus]|uniref:Short-chain dehydrogenase/reductase 3 n=1 Tax=Clohesyomyces aquaticus TaxID=1231657 RepID=A0A1Y1Z0L2_9PLEO|nr:short chain dehydrogenase/reductase-like protein [Clohesyomyces aquaticus]
MRCINAYYSFWSLNNYVDDKSWDWNEEFVLITGGSGGIGADMARRFAKRGIKIAIWDITIPASDLLENSCVKYYHVDVTSDEQIVETAKQMRLDVGDPSVLINNAGIAIAKTILEETTEQRKRQFDVNIFAQMRMVQEFLPAMTKRDHGHIVTMASASSFISTTRLTTYASSKAAVMAFHEGLGQELRMRYNARKIRTTIVYPHFVRTAMVESLTTLHDFPELLLDPEYVGQAVVDQVLTGYAGRVILPPSNAWLARLRALPPWYMYHIHSLDPDVYKPRN